MYKNMLKIYRNTHPAMYSMAVGYILDKGMKTTRGITDEEISELKGNAMMTKEFVQGLVRTARKIADECGSNVVELIQFCQAEDVFDSKWYKGSTSDAIATRIGYMKPGYNRETETEFDTTDEDELKELWWDYCMDNGIITYTEEVKEEN